MEVSVVVDRSSMVDGSMDNGSSVVDRGVHNTAIVVAVVGVATVAGVVIAMNIVTAAVTIGIVVIVAVRVTVVTIGVTSIGVAVVAVGIAPVVVRVMARDVGVVVAVGVMTVSAADSAGSTSGKSNKGSNAKSDLNWRKMVMTMCLNKKH